MGVQLAVHLVPFYFFLNFTLSFSFLSNLFHHFSSLLLPCFCILSGSSWQFISSSFTFFSILHSHFLFFLICFITFPLSLLPCFCILSGSSWQFISSPFTFFSILHSHFLFFLIFLSLFLSPCSPASAFYQGPADSSSRPL